MRRMTLIVGPEVSVQQRVSLSSWLATPENTVRVAFWHWIDNSWLIVDYADRDLVFWRDIIRTYCGADSTRWFLQEIPDGAWFCNVPIASHPWLRVHWIGPVE